VAAHWIADRQIGPSVLRHGTPELQAEMLPGICRAETTFCLGMSEPQAGSDLAAVRTRAKRVPGGWRLVRLEDVFVPEHRLLGTEGRGWQQVVSHTAHRLHGAIGLTQEHPLHRHTLLLWEWRDRPDGAHADAEARGRLALTEGPDVVWNSLTTPAL
jgi:alkylation response protein AidB-like acyl-CoA dehydrogenase